MSDTLATAESDLLSLSYVGDNFISVSVFSDITPVRIDQRIQKLNLFCINPYPAAKVYTSTISTAAKVSVNKCSTEDAHIPPLSPYSIFILMFTIINIIWKLKSKLHDDINYICIIGIIRELSRVDINIVYYMKKLHHLHIILQMSVYVKHITMYLLLSNFQYILP